eukprot:644855-Pyramimonas_sp.AAC.1
MSAGGDEPMIVRQWCGSVGTPIQEPHHCHWTPKWLQRAPQWHRYGYPRLCEKPLRSAILDAAPAEPKSRT